MNIATITDIFQGNPFSTPIGQLIEKATDSAQVTDNWTLYIAICDHINSLEEGPRDSLRAIRRRFTTAITNKNVPTALYSLTLLETCVKNCGYRFHLLLATRDVMQDLIKGIGPRAEIPSAIQDKVLALIQSWMDAFKGQVDLKEIGRTYEELVERGVEFPMTNVDDLVPINTPKSASTVKPGHGLVSKSMRTVPDSKNHVPASALPVEDLATMKQRLLMELEGVKVNVQIFNDIMTEYPPTDALPEEAIILLKELAYTCSQMHSRIGILLRQQQLDSPGDDINILTIELVSTIDQLNDVFMRYERYQCGFSESASAHAPPNFSQIAKPDPNATPDLINLSLNDACSLRAVTDGPTPKVVNGNVAQSYVNQQCGDFTDGVNSHRQKATTGEAPFIEGIPDTQTDLDEMEKWMSEHEANRRKQQASAANSKTLTSSEFDEFLNQRVGGASSASQQPALSNRRQMKQEDDKEDAMFAL